MELQVGVIYTFHFNYIPFELPVQKLVQLHLELETNLLVQDVIKLEFELPIKNVDETNQSPAGLVIVITAPLFVKLCLNNLEHFKDSGLSFLYHHIYFQKSKPQIKLLIVATYLPPEEHINHSL